MKIIQLPPASSVPEGYTLKVANDVDELILIRAPAGDTLTLEPGKRILKSIRRWLRRL